MKTFIRILAVMGVIAGLAGCPQIDSYKYMAFDEKGEAAPRTIEAAKARFKDKTLVVGQTTKDDLRKLLGTPETLRADEKGRQIYVYVKNVRTKGFSEQMGTTYIARYTLDAEGILFDKQYWAQPMAVDD
ncbi:hypothetical protein TAO_0334 [Candidatus Nitrosoglobus terrae]|uniref:Lipoprotein SmpA/OmlA domain-containing protein n=1 Tax=Candidatus Nitrosoglobus terrae TaxID=1630141 RepID=A0A1Q2SKR2_9GAMM|nr:hypothetical protein [Candidatus Nitrosoglobus terrae]BAW79704.1 hypothetical protein TAO_0334 [Candidatus Nitrosoglobus terrae]